MTELLKKSFETPVDRNSLIREIANLAVNHTIEHQFNIEKFDAEQHLNDLRFLANILPLIPIPLAKSEFNSRLLSDKVFKHLKTEPFIELLYENQDKMTQSYPADYIRTVDHLAENYLSTFRRLFYLSKLFREVNEQSDLCESQTTALMHEIYQEWHEFNQLRFDISPNMKVIGTPLVWRSVSELKDALANNLPIDKSDILRIFNNKPRKFHEYIAQQNEPKKLRSPSPTRPNAVELNFSRFVKDPLAFSRLKILSETKNIDGITFECSDFEDMDDVIFTVIAMNYKNANDQYGYPVKNVWNVGNSKSVASKLKPKGFYGSYANYKVIVMPPDDKFTDSYLKLIQNPKEIDRSSVTRLCAIVSLKSTGRGIIGESLQDVIIYTRNAEDPKKRRVVKSIRGNCSGDKIVQYLNLESSEIAKRVLVDSLQHTFRGGLPGLGKRY